MFKRVTIFTLLLVLLLAGFRMAASFFIGEYIKEYVEQIPVLKITVDKVSAFPDTGEFTFNNVKVFDVKFKENTELKLIAKRLTVDFRWWQSAGYKYLIADVDIDSPTFWVLSKKDFRESIVEKTIRKLFKWGGEVNEKGIRVDIARVRIRNGTLIFTDQRTEPQLELTMKKIDVTLTDLGFRSDRPRPNESPYELTGIAEDTATVKLYGTMKFDGSNNHGTFNIDIKNLKLSSLAKLSARYGDFEYQDGKIDIEGKAEIKNSIYSGSISSTFHQVVIKRWGGKSNVEAATASFWKRTYNSSMIPVPTNKEKEGIRKMRIDFTYPINEVGAEWWAQLGSMFKLSVARSFTPPYN